MNRRSFIYFVTRSLAVSCLSGLVPISVWSKTAFDFALEGQNLIQRGKYAEAVAVLTKAAKLNPESDWTYGLLGRSYHGLGKRREAVDAFRNAVRLNPEDVYSRMMIEILTQTPLPKVTKQKEDTLTSLELSAREEETRMRQHFDRGKDLSYKLNRVVIDPGHGGFDPGAIGHSGLKEKDVTLDIATNLNQRLMQHGTIKSFLTRRGDYYVPLSDRTAIANQFKADLFLSIHINASTNKKASGSEIFYCSSTASNKEAARVAAFENAVLKFDEPFKKQAGYIDIEEILFRFEQKLYWQESSRFAGTFQEKFLSSLPLKNRGISSANFFVLRRAKMPSILLELGFISHRTDERRLMQPEFRDEIANAIFRSLA